MLYAKTVRFDCPWNINLLPRVLSVLCKSFTIAEQLNNISFDRTSYNFTIEHHDTFDVLMLTRKVLDRREEMKKLNVTHNPHTEHVKLSNNSKRLVLKNLHINKAYVKAIEQKINELCHKHHMYAVKYKIHLHPHHIEIKDRLNKKTKKMEAHIVLHAHKHDKVHNWKCPKLHTKLVKHLIKGDKRS